ncbi:MAG: CocE/NonD family hydrolase [Alphaproteobacteria bacterium]|nr:CocE/NonD family hydrolase [Alphaproteobacteria bacterium]
MSAAGNKPRRVKERPTVWIKLADGTRLAARIWMPTDARKNPVPAILEYVPYRRRDSTAPRDALTHPYFAAQGYACVRLDMRGSGDSDAILHDEYSKQEHDDALEAIAWIAKQPWCTGKVGMMGISWGGFNALQVAARRPPALKAIITVASTDDRYADDIHFMGGCLINDHIEWASTMFAFNSRPPDPTVVGDRWRSLWLDRLNHNEPWLLKWMEHQRRDAQWTHGSVCEDYGAIQAAVYAVGGWADAYSNAVPRLLAGLTCPRKGLVGPWGHAYAHMAKPGPAIGFLAEAVRWWDHWLKDVDTGIMREPSYRAWMQDSVRPKAQYDERPGRWIAEPSWPSPNVTPRTYALNRGTIDDKAGAESPMILATPVTTGWAGGEWCPYGFESEMPTDQRDEDGASLTFDSGPLAERVEILGAPVVTLELAADKTCAFVAVRLNDVAPDGASTRVTYGLLNLTHRESHADPTPLVPGQRYRVRVRLNDIAHAFPPGHRIRVAVSENYFPLVFSSPEAVTLTVHAGACGLELPVRPPRRDDETLAPFGPPEHLPPMRVTEIEPASRARFCHRDIGAGITEVTIKRSRGKTRLEDIGLTLSAGCVDTHRIVDGDPSSMTSTSAWTVTLERGDWRIRTQTHLVLGATPTAFVINGTLQAFEGETRVFARTWDRTIPRDLV